MPINAKNQSIPLPESVGDGEFGLTRLGPLPQAPFFPQSVPLGPSFLDTQACLCALQPTPDQKTDTAAWQCIGDQSQGVYNTTSGKWFNTLHGGKNVKLPIDDASNGPETSKPLIWDEQEALLVPLANSNTLSVFDQACTGNNHTTFSTSFYRATSDLSNDKPPVDGFPCYVPGAVPILIQNVTSWQSKGCSEGFLCANATVNSLPQYCPPPAICQQSRLAGKVCVFQDKNIGMGPFEPVVCQAGWYCPTSSGGRETLICPAGHYCQPGASTPTPCSVGSQCPQGSSFQMFLIPIILLILFDAMLVVGLLVIRIRERSGDKTPRLLAFLGKSKAVRGVKAGITGYKQLEDETDHEMVAMDATYMPSRDGWTGFQAALEMENFQHEPLRRAGTVLNPQLQTFVDSMRRATDNTDFGLSFGYSNLSFHPKGSPRPILQNVTGSVKRGSLVAVMGGSGAGKSTFVNVLMGKTTNTGGTVMVNNVPGKIKRYKKLIGYVPQDDVVLPELTVYENIVHSARVRLPKNWTDAEVEAHVSSVIDCLELSHVRDSMVGSVGKPVISGGQRKRVSIGMELAAAPMAIFLDEPTSGLDATAASSVMRTLKALARLGISVIVIIHQPRVEIFEMIDDLILLGNGQIIYEGPERDVQHFFENIGFSFPPHTNLGDVVTDIITGNGRAYKKSGDISKDALISHWANSHRSTDENEDTSSHSSPERHSVHSIHHRKDAARLKQTWLCLRRAMIQQYRLKSAFFFEMGLASLAGFLIGLAENPKKGVLFTGFYNPPYEILSVAADFGSAQELALLQAIAIGLVSGAPGVKVFSEEMILHHREAEAGHSRVAYFLAKIISVLPRMILGCLHFTNLVMLLTSPTVSWGIAFCANLAYFYCIYGLASCVSMVVRREDAPLISTMISLVVGLLSGSAPPLSTVKSWNLEWLWRASPGVWLAEIYFGQVVAPFRYLYDVELAATATGYHLDWLWVNMLALLSIGTIYRIVAYIGLFFGKRLRI